MSKKQRKPISKKKNTSSNHHVNSKYKDTLFRMIFRDKKNLLSLYNALNKTSYTNPDDMKITTLEDVIYVGMKNDVSFLLSSIMNLFEHQSTFNPNMPVRGLLYLARIYQNYIRENGLNIYSSTQISLPVPVYVVFYNGRKEEAEYQELKLSDAFKKSEFSGQAALECRVIMLNINLGHNKELFENCRILWEYAYFINEVRENQKKGSSIEAAVRQAQKSCIEQDILKEFLEKNSAEVSDVILEEFNEEQYAEGLREEGKAKTLISLYQKNLLTLEQAAEEYGTTVEEFQKLLARKV